MKKKSVSKGFLAAVAASALLVGCGSTAGSGATSVYEEAYDTAYDSGAVFTNEAVAEEVYDAAEAETEGVQELPETLSGRKLIKNVNLSVETEQFDALLPALEQRVAALGGYIEEMSSYSRGDNYSADYIGTKYLRYASMTVRIPKEQLEAFLAEVDEQSNVVSRSESVTDVTLQYVDLESHKKALNTEQDRLLELLGQAETVEDIIAIEGKLSEVRYQIESMESQLRTYDNQIDYSTVYLSIDEVERYTPTQEITVGTRIRDGFLDSVKGVGRGLGNFAIWFVVNLPYLIVWALVLVVIVLILHRIWRAAAKRRAQRAAKRVSPYPQQGSVPGANPYPQPEETAAADPGDAENAHGAENAGKQKEE